MSARLTVPTMLVALLALVGAGTAAAGVVPAPVAAGQAGTSQVDADTRCGGLVGHDPALPGDGRQFVWPVPAWVAANDYYRNGTEHCGTADLAAQHYTPIRPARDGTVAGINQDGHSWTIKLAHGGDDRYTYFTRYGHLAERPLVDEGDRVYAGRDGGTVIGYLGRTGNADLSGPHIHFRITRVDTDGGETLLKVPGLDIGDWAKAGRHIPGVYAGLDPIASPSVEFHVRVTQRGVFRVYETTGRSPHGRLGTLQRGDVARVVDSYRGQYKITRGSLTGWVAHSGIEPADSPIFRVRVTPGSGYTSINVRRTPGGSVIGIAPKDVLRSALLSGFERRTVDGTTWYRVLWRCTPDTNRSNTQGDTDRVLGGCPGLSSGYRYKYGWVSSNVTDLTSHILARTRIDGLRVYGGKTVNGVPQPDTGNQLGRLGNSTSLVAVHGTYNGWYRITYNGNSSAWIRGWFTSGQQ